MAANAVELTIRSIDRSTVVKISPYECAYGFRSSQFLRDLLNESRGFTYSKSIKDESARPFKYSRTIVKAPVSKKCINTFVVVEDSNHHNIMAALEYIHKVSNDRDEHSSCDEVPCVFLQGNSRLELR